MLTCCGPAARGPCGCSEKGGPESPGCIQDSAPGEGPRGCWSAQWLHRYGAEVPTHGFSGQRPIPAGLVGGDWCSRARGPSWRRKVQVEVIQPAGKAQFLGCPERDPRLCGRGGSPLSPVQPWVLARRQPRQGDHSVGLQGRGRRPQAMSLWGAVPQGDLGRSPAGMDKGGLSSLPFPVGSL